MQRYFLLLFFLLACPVSGKAEDHLYHYTKSIHVSDKDWEAVQPYLLPSNHPIKAKLDKIFASRPSASEVRLKNAGFTKPKRRPQSKMVVSHHKALPGYLVKLFTDDHHADDCALMIHRIKGAHCIAKSIKKHGYEKFFKVPKKWIYPLPVSKSGKKGHNFILVVEDMNILSRPRNYKKWKSRAMTKSLATAIFVILKENGLKDNIHPFNLPFCRDGKLAFIDTEYHHCHPVYFVRMTRHMPASLRPFWQELIAGQPLH